MHAARAYTSRVFLPRHRLLELNQRQTFILAILVLFLGRWLNRRVALLREWNIPEPVTGGVVASIAFGVLYLAGNAAVSFTLDWRDGLLIVFFTTIGLSADIRTLAAGGTMLVVLTLVAIANLWLQNGVGIAVAELLGANPAIGLLAGSIGFSGGHGTAIAWAPTLQSTFNLSGALEIGTAVATFGLVAGGVLGGPLGRFLIRRHRLEPGSASPTSVGFAYAEEGRLKLDVNGMLQTLLVIAIAVGIGSQFNRLLADWGFRLPEFVTALFAGIVLANIVPRLLPGLAWPTGTPPLALVADLSLGLFLSMSLMSLQLWTLLHVAGPLLAILIAQVAVCWGLLAWVVFRLLGRTYDAAVSTSGYFGLAMGATPTAIAVMTAITKAHGASPRSFVIVPLVGAFFVDIANAITIQTIVGLMGR
jgi:glutamate:Na+ symporter, ESS family